ncbi:MAG: TonB-dependent receptor [Cyclobacteriaceae bacterium]
MVYTITNLPLSRKFRMILLIKLSALFFLGSIDQVQASTTGNEETISISVQQESLRRILREIRKQSDYNFIFQSAVLNEVPEMSIDVKNAQVSDVLDRLIKEHNLEYEIDENTIIIRKSKVPLIEDVEVSGRVIDTNTGEPIIGATVIIKGTSQGAVTDLNGNFTIDVEQGQTLVISFLGYARQEVVVGGQTNLSISLVEDASNLGSVVISGSRGRPRTVLESPVAIDNINASALAQSGQYNIEQMINYRVPSYNSSNQTISDATAHFDPSELRNMGPSRTLVLVNGKRKNQSALVYVNDTPGKGEVGVDLKSVPTGAIERIEVLRDGAAAQYGSDAIAGVINIVLKERVTGSAQVSSGVTTEGDGFTYDASVNKGFLLGNDGVLNLTGNFYHQDLTNRAGEPGGDGLFGVIFQPNPQDVIDGNITQAEFDAQQASANSILNGTHPWLVDNPDLGMTIGQPEYDKASFMANLSLPYGEGNEFYAFGGYTYRDGKSFALYRAPYWVTDDAGLLTPSGEAYQGFQPTFETEINDLTFTAGTKNKLGAWNSDLSITTGSNSVDYTIGSTINVSLLPNSPTSFNAGGYKFGTIVGNFDISRNLDDVTVFFGSEVRSESFEVTAGQQESYVDGGAQSFPGLQPGNALDESRNNIGFYGGLDWDVSEEFLVGGAVRYENYSDFGSNLSWKINARQLFAGSKGSIRASVSTGFRAPSLHQIYLSNVQTLVSGGTVSNQGTFNNVSDVIRGLGIPALDAETSLNFTAGVTYRLTDNFSVTADYYSIDLDDRVLFTGEIGFDADDATTNSVEQILIANDVTSIKFFVNALDTKTTGFDLILDYTGIELGASSQLDMTLSMNSNETKIDGSIVAPGVIGQEGYDIFNRKEQSRVTTARPNFKILYGLNFSFGDLGVSINNTYFGEVTWQHGTDPANDQTFSGKVITDLVADYDLSEKLNINVVVNNLFNVYPDVIETGGDFVTDLGGRFKYPWEVNQFGFNGTILKAGLNYKF